jgi:hypothetical protein
MASLTGSSIASSYEQLLALPDGGLNGTTLVAITDGDSATEVGFKISTNALSMNSTNQLQFGDTGTYIHQSADGVLDLVSDTEIEINATTIDMNGALDLSGNATIGGTATISGNILSSDKGIITNASGEFSAYATSGNMLKLGANGSDAHLQIDINGHISATGIKSYLAFYDNDGSTLAGYVGSGQDMAFGDANDLCIRGVDSIKFTANNGDADAMTIDSSANVGIGSGSSSPATPLHVADDGSSNGIMSNQMVRITPADGNNGLNIGSDGTDAMIGVTNNDTDLHFLSRTGGTYSKAMTIDGATGSVGIGTASINGAFTVLGTPMTAVGHQTVADIFGNVQQDADKGAGIGLGGRYITDADSVTAFAEILGVKANNTSANYEGEMVFKTRVNGGNQVERMRLDANSRISLSNNDSGSGNTIFGYLAGESIEGTNTQNNTFIGTKSGYAGTFDSAQNNTAVGHFSLQDLTSGDNNVAIGKSAGENITSGSNNTIMGRLTADALTTGSSNIVIGDSALGTATTATLNVAIGGDSMSLVPADVAIQDVVAVGQNAFKGASGTTTGANGTVAIGRDSLTALTSGARNLAIGYQSLYQADTIDDSIAIGYQAMGGTDAGTNNKNIAIGNYALDHSLANSIHNVAIGYNALTKSSSGASNVAIGGSGAGGEITTAGRIVAIGDGALGGAVQSQGNTGVGYATLYSTTGAKNTAFGYQAGNTVTSGTENTVVGWDADVTGSGAVNQTVIGSETTGVADNSVTLGNADVTDVYMASDKGATVHCAKVEVEGNISSGFIGQFENDGNDANRYGLNVVAGADDGSGTTYYLACKDGDGDSVGFIANTSGTFALTDVSDQRLKKNIVDTSIKGIEKINQLKVRDFDWKKSEEKTVGGFIAQEVKDVFPQAVNETNTTVDGEENIMGVSRDMLVPLLIKAVQELSAKITELENK